MADEKKINLAKEVYSTLCKALDNRGWKYEKDEEEFLVHFGVNGEDLPINFVILVDVDRQLIRVLSSLPFKMSEEKRIDGAIAACAATYKMADGGFEYDISDGSIVFKTAACFSESVIGEGIFRYMIALTCAMVEKYNDKFFALNKGLIKIEDFLKED